jgi:hypothetical protein
MQSGLAYIDDMKNEIIIRRKCDKKNCSYPPSATCQNLAEVAQWLLDNVREYRCYGTDGTLRHLQISGKDVQIVAMAQDATRMDDCDNIPTRLMPIAEMQDLVVIRATHPLWQMVK